MEKIKDKNSIAYDNITDTLDEYKDDIDLFIENLGPEKKYFAVTTARIMRSVIVLLIRKNNTIIGIAGIERKYGVLRNYITLLKEYHRGGVGSECTVKLLAEAKKKCNIIMAVVEENNMAALKGARSLGFRKAGQRENLCYIWKPLNIKGNIVYHIISFFFPVIKLVDFFRR